MTARGGVTVTVPLTIGPHRLDAHHRARGDFRRDLVIRHRAKDGPRAQKNPVFVAGFNAWP